MSSQSGEPANLLKRIEILERAYRRWRLVALLAGLMVVVGAAIAVAQSQQTGPPILRAGGFVLVNHVGNEVASFGMVNYSPALSFLDGTGRPNTQLTAATLEIGSHDTTYGRVKLGSDGLSITGKRLHGVQIAPTVVITTDNGPGLHMLGSLPSVMLTNQRQGIILRSGSEGVPATAWRGAGSPSIELSDYRTKSKVVLGQMISTSGRHGDVQEIESTGIALTMMDDAGTPRLQLVGGLRPRLEVFDDGGQSRALFGRTLSFNPDSSQPPYAVTVTGGAGEIEWQAPPARPACK